MLYDSDIREPLFDYIEDTFGKSRILEEKIMGKARADVILVCPNEIIGFEIKSSADTYERLKGQVRNYNKFCDRNYIVTGLRHVKHISEYIPAFWGIICVYEDNKKIIIEPIREASVNPKCKLEAQLSWLWKPELSNILHKNHLPKYAAKSKAFICDKLFQKMSYEDLKPQLCEELFERDYTLFNEMD